jgi:hypothetical protein
MKYLVTLFILSLTLSANDVWAYGSSSSSACTKPKFTEFKPVNNAVIAAGATFSFMASAGTNPESIVVTVKSLPVDITVSDKNKNLFVQGKLPTSLKGDFARININAEGPNQCKGSDGWLVKIE